MSAQDEEALQLLADLWLAGGNPSLAQAVTDERQKLERTLLGGRWNDGAFDIADPPVQARGMWAQKYVRPPAHGVLGPAEWAVLQGCLSLKLDHRRRKILGFLSLPGSTTKIIAIRVGQETRHIRRVKGEIFRAAIRCRVEIKADLRGARPE